MTDREVLFKLAEMLKSSLVCEHKLIHRVQTGQWQSLLEANEAAQREIDKLLEALRWERTMASVEKAALSGEMICFSCKEVMPPVENKTNAWYCKRCGIWRERLRQEDFLPRDPT